MKLFEFFSKNNADEEESKIEVDLQKDVMGCILDDDDLYKESIRPLVSKIARGVKVEAEEFMDAVNRGCLKFYKEKEFKKDPNEMFPLTMRKAMAKDLLDINSKGAKKNENKAIIVGK